MPQRDVGYHSIAACEEGVDRLVAEIWGLSKHELKDIQDSLKDLKS
jgi:hypothetical protein